MSKTSAYSSRYQTEAASKPCSIINVLIPFDWQVAPRRRALTDRQTDTSAGNVMEF